jgi:hypothetical protein
LFSSRSNARYFSEYMLYLELSVQRVPFNPPLLFLVDRGETSWGGGVWRPSLEQGYWFGALPLNRGIGHKKVRSVKKSKIAHNFLKLKI